MNINDLTLGQLKELGSLFGKTESCGQDDSHWEIGKPYQLRTVTHILTGTLEKVTPTELVISNAAWIADTGKFSNAMKDSVNYDEVEMYQSDKKPIVNRAALIDAVIINNLPTETK